MGRRPPTHIGWIALAALLLTTQTGCRGGGALLALGALATAGAVVHTVDAIADHPHHCHGCDVRVVYQSTPPPPQPPPPVAYPADGEATYPPDYHFHGQWGHAHHHHGWHHHGYPGADPNDPYLWRPDRCEPHRHLEPDDGDEGEDHHHHPHDHRGDRRGEHSGSQS